MAEYSFRNSGRNSDGRQSSLSVQGETMGRQSPAGNPKKTYKYRVVSHESAVDETLFASHRDRRMQMTRDRTESQPQKALSQTKKSSPAIKPHLSSMPRTRNKYRIVKHTPTYVDQSLFGPRLEEPSFEAPWTDKKEDRRRNTPLMWGPPVHGSLSFSDTGSRPTSAAADHPRSSSGVRPRSSSGSRPRSASGSRPSTPSKPPWK